jgi:serine/threonine protein kinase
LGPYFNAPAGKEIRPSGRELTIGSHQLSPIQTIDGDASELVFADGLRSFVDCPTEQWDFDEYDDDDDLGYIRKPVEDEAWILAHEMDYLNNNVQRRYEHRTTPIQKDNNAKKNQDENLSFVENLYFLGEQSNDIEPKAVSQDLFGLCTANLYGKRDYSGLADRHDGQLVGDGEKNLMLVSSEWQGFAMQSNGVEMLSSEEIPSNDQQPRENIFWVDDDQHQLVRSTFLKNYDIEDAGTDLRGSFVVLSSEAVGIDGSKPVKYDQSSSSHSSLDRAEEVRERQEPENDKMVRYESDSWRDHTAIYECQAGKSELEKGFIKDDLKERHNELYSQNPYSRSLDFEGFSFPNPSGTGDMVEFKVEPGKPLWSTNMNSIVFEGTHVYGHAMVGPDVQIPPRKKSNGSSPIASQRDGDLNVVCPMHLTTSTLGSTERIINKGENFNDIDDGDVGVIEDEEAVALQEQVQQIKAQEDEFETFDLQIVHRRNRTGFEEDKNYHVDLNSVIAGHYHVIEKLGSASFSNAVQARDLHTGMDVCLKIIKNNKEFFDQSLDEIKLLKFVNRHDPADKYHILRLYNYFYYHEHLFIVCELLKANLYEFNKFNRESGGEVYFTMPRIQSVAIQCLEALQFLHNLGLIHCDLKPENILVKSYSRCEVKVIDLGSSCFETDHLCPYVQSRSYRAPEVILGLPYDKRIDIWSLGCILAELCSGNVLFQNESSATLLARIIGIVGPIKAEMLDMGHNTHKYFTKNYVLYEQNKDTNRLELLMPKKTSLRHRLSMGDEGFIDFVSYLLEINPKKRPTASEALQHPWLSYPYEPISS